jgi:hypothetical protein
MTDPKNDMKLTGEGQLPDTGFEPIGSRAGAGVLFVPEETLGPRVYADGYVPPEQRVVEAETQGPVGTAVAKIENFEAKSPWLAIGVGVALGWLVARMVRR